eukprot:GEMP01105810.1.p1 GENE.GEMP01105810.1~~GEMP01105810.1.p1  ORF type:complete len:133 (+),score=16.60 GEMP01105810.1:301-699(+)
MFMMPNEGSLSFFSKFMTRSNLGTQLLIAACIVWSFILGSGFAYVVRQYSSHSDEDDKQGIPRRTAALPPHLRASAPQVAVIRRFRETRAGWEVQKGTTAHTELLGKGGNVAAHRTLLVVELDGWRGLRLNV